MKSPRHDASHFPAQAALIADEVSYDLTARGSM
jgi:hypothetical protein